MFTARYAQGAEYAEIIIYSFAVERTAKEKLFALVANKAFKLVLALQKY
jgi:hypothetical protein